MSKAVKFDEGAPFSTVEGDSRARYYQRGQYFTAAHKPISHEEAALPSEGGSFESRVRQEVEKAGKPTDAELDAAATFSDPGNPQRQQKPSPAIEEPQKQDDEEWLDETQDDRGEKLKELATKEINNLVAHAGGEKFLGANARQNAIDWLLENTE